MSKLTTSLIGETMTTSKKNVEKQQQHLLAKEVFSPLITKFRRERIIPLYKDNDYIDMKDTYKIQMYILR